MLELYSWALLARQIRSQIKGFTWIVLGVTVTIYVKDYIRFPCPARGVLWGLQRRVPLQVLTYHELLSILYVTRYFKYIYIYRWVRYFRKHCFWYEMLKRQAAYTVTIPADSTDSLSPCFETRNTDAHAGKKRLSGYTGEKRASWQYMGLFHPVASGVFTLAIGTHVHLRGI